MKNAWFLVLAFGLATSACSDDEGSVDQSTPKGVGGSSAGSSAQGGASQASGGTSSALGGSSTSVETSTIAGSSAVSVAGSSSVAGASSTGGVSAVAGSSSAVAGSMSSGGSQSSGGATSVAGTSSVGGSSSTGGTTSAGGSTPVGVLNCGSVIKGNAELVPVTIMHRPEYSSNVKATFYAGCAKTSNDTDGWGVLCPEMACNTECVCMTYVPAGTWIRFNIDRGSYAWAVGSLGNASALCPNNYDATKGCLGKEDLIRKGLVFVNGTLMGVDQAEKNQQNNGYNFLTQITN